MEDAALKNIWLDYDRKMDEARLLNLQSWALNLQCFHSLQTQKAKSRLDSLLRFKMRAVVLGIGWVSILGLLLYGNHLRNLYFTVSVGMIILISATAILCYIRQIRQIRRIDYSENIMDTQERLTALQLSTVAIARFSWLQLPFYATWFWDKRWIDYGSLNFWLLLFPITLFFFLLAIFLYRNISVKNMNRRWVRALLMAGPEYKSLVQAKKFVAEIEEFKKDLVLKKEFSNI